MMFKLYRETENVNTVNRKHVQSVESKNLIYITRKFNKKLIISIIVLIEILIMQFFNISRNKIVSSIIQTKKAETESQVTIEETKIEYEIMAISGTTAQILINITDEANGIKQVEYPDGHTVYCNGDEKRKKLALDYEAELGEEYIFKITTGDGKETEKKIVVINNFEVEVSEITQTGFNMNLSLTEAELAKVEEIKYYVNDSIEGTNYQTTETVTGLSDYTKKYVWADIIYNSGEIKRSSNYRVVYTKHEHNSTCYQTRITIDEYYKLKRDNDNKYNDTVIRTQCDICNHKCSMAVAYLANYNTSENEYIHQDCHSTSNCEALEEWNYLDGAEWSSSERTVYYYNCPSCGSNGYDSNSNVTCYKCRSTRDNSYLICSKSGSGVTYNYQF